MAALSLGVDSELVHGGALEPFIPFLPPPGNQSISQHGQPGCARRWLPEGRHSRMTGADRVVTADGTECVQEAIVHSSWSRSQHWLDSSSQAPNPALPVNEPLAPASCPPLLQTSVPRTRTAHGCVNSTVYSFSGHANIFHLSYLSAH